MIDRVDGSIQELAHCSTGRNPELGYNEILEEKVDLRNTECACNLAAQIPGHVSASPIISPTTLELTSV